MFSSSFPHNLSKLFELKDRNRTAYLKQLEEIKLTGNYAPNIRTMQNGKGIFVVMRRPSGLETLCSSHKNYQPCKKVGSEQNDFDKIFRNEHSNLKFKMCLLEYIQ